MVKEMQKFVAGKYDVIVVGTGHAGCEAGLASARMGMKTLMLAISLESVAAMPCNPNIGGTGKGHLVREIDALGGEMALNIDKSFIQSRMLNTSKGPAVHSLRVQADKKKYHKEMKKTLENEENLNLRQGEVVDLVVEDGKVKGVITRTGAVFYGKAIILATGTYLRGRIFIGEVNYSSGPEGLSPANILSESLEKIGIKLRRFKTGTPARVHKDSLDFSKMELQPGDEEVIPFSFLNIGKDFNFEQKPCHLTYTTEKTHEIIRNNLHRASMYSGDIKGVGPRYCPSIEDKIVRFADKDRHQIFIEPEGLDTKEMYVQGGSSTLPEEVQLEMYRTIIGLEKVEFMRIAHAIEYDCIDPTILKTTLEHNSIENLYYAGQINGSSGYEEAAAQGLMAGINAVLKIKGEKPFILDRSEAYIGVLIDDLVTKGTNEPYRMMTSRAEYRLTLRQDNADLRLTEKGYKIGLVSEERYKKMLVKKELVEGELSRLREVKITPKPEVNDLLEKWKTSSLKTTSSLYELIKRPELNYELLKVLDESRPSLPREIKLQVETHIKYEGYIRKQMAQIEQFKKLEEKKLSTDFDYSKVKGMRIEAVQKLNNIKPDSIGQASRISGVSPADINVLLIHLEKLKR
ncbi:MAG TPA: tRNA uridine-5-carboxymethylaminomethyl(34) synthesis enzyme MnmG [Tissierellales bacterium]|nr:tRNA uridine-5-carboxymethylaminomethyl(34) synthesis enzyme MnmG [Tissierellales bacterium]